MPDLKVLLDEFIDSLTPAHHKATAAPFANVEMSYANLRSAAEALLAKAGVVEDQPAAETEAAAESTDKIETGEGTDPSLLQTA